MKIIENLIYKGFPIEVWEIKNYQYKYSCKALSETLFSSFSSLTDFLESEFISKGILYKDAKNNSDKFIIIYSSILFITGVFYLFLKLLTHGKYYLL